jgi:signal transduction histidine kinase
MNDEPTPFDQKLFFIFIVTFASVLAFEFAWQFIYPYPPDWRTNIITSLFVSGLAVVIAYFPLNAYYDQNIRLHSEIERRQSVEMILRKSEDSLMQANRQINLMTSITRHDINNQLTVLQGYLVMLGMEQHGPMVKEYHQNAATAAKRIASMIQFTKEYESVGIKPPTWQICHTLVENAGKEAQLGLILKNDLHMNAEILGDPLISKVFDNLIDNAIRYGGKITTLKFSVHESGDNHLMICEDDGNGIPAEEKERIFERGYGKNTGLGLFLVREILNITSIAIRENGEPGKGARFELTIPKTAWRMVGSRAEENTGAR